MKTTLLWIILLISLTCMVHGQSINVNASSKVTKVKRIKTKLSSPTVDIDISSSTESITNQTYPTSTENELKSTMKTTEIISNDVTEKKVKIKKPKTTKSDVTNPQFVSEIFTTELTTIQPNQGIRYKLIQNEMENFKFDESSDEIQEVTLPSTTSKSFKLKTSQLKTKLFPNIITLKATENNTKRKINAYSFALTIFYSSFSNDNLTDCLYLKKRKKLHHSLRGNKTAMVKQGIYIGGCGRKQYLISNKNLAGTYEYQTFCSENGMVFATIETRQEMDCIYNAYLKFKDGFIAVETLIRLAYKDRTLTHKYIVTCPEEHSVPNDLWGPNDPNNHMGLEACTALFISNNKTAVGINDVDCMSFKQVLCQAYF